MKIIEALKAVKELQRKAEDLRTKIQKHSAHLSHETPVYQNQRQQVSEWLQAHSDLLKEVLDLRVRIQRTNLATPVTIEIDGKSITKSIAEWIHRRKDLAQLEEVSWKALTDRGLVESKTRQSTGEILEIKIIRCYAPEERDKKLDVFSNEPHLVDGKLEVVNAVTDLLD
jgi:hypothetical protein